MLATIRKLISFPAAGALGKITVTGLVGCHANANAGISDNRVRIVFIYNIYARLQWDYKNFEYILRLLHVHVPMGVTYRL